MPEARAGAHRTAGGRRAPAAVLIACLVGASAGPAGPEEAPFEARRPAAHDLEGMRLGLVMLGPNAARAFEDAAVAADPGTLTLSQIEAIYAVLSRAIRIGPQERERIKAILAR